MFALGPAGWTPQQTVYASDAAAEDRFGEVLALQGNRLVAVSPSHQHPVLGELGSVYVH